MSMPVEPDDLTDTVEDATAAAGLVLTDGDAAIFKHIYDFRLLRRDHLSALTGRPAKRLHRRIFKLLAGGYLTSIRLPQQKHIYALGKAAMPGLVEQGLAEPELVAQRSRVHELKELFLKHELLIVDIHVALALAAGELQLVAWREGRELVDTVTVPDQHGMKQLPVRPDAFFTLEDSRRPPGANRAHFFLEADRSTMAQSRFVEKIQAYWHYLEQGLHEKKYGIKNFRVLTVTMTDQRAANLSALAVSILPERARKYYLFTSRENVSPQSVFGVVYYSPRSATERYPLIPPPNAPTNDSATA